MDTVNAMICCIPCTGEPPDQQWHVGTADGDIADRFVETLLKAEKPGKSLDDELKDVMGTTGMNWREKLGKTILAKLERAIVIGAQMSSGMKEALDKSIAAAEGFAKEHPVYTTLIAIGVLAVLSPWVIEALGFGELGPIGGEIVLGEQDMSFWLTTSFCIGSFAAAWQRSYAGYVERGTLFAFFQRVGMVWRRYPKT
ncbi:uncharacterized protein BKCO1_25000139 [Diplodia corticola]|uniref:Uncharacterized protein n=1 Tax=Diplodia corticola TaxID=236234 RepID=A0A1J9S3H0_9PEZI|nr:uncharacterized protein BKCO1_25000139 [Diplodia corticola]OJD34173.1 hypothetical protein BKCO1_25000139 [Diplodia corticola]